MITRIIAITGMVAMLLPSVAVAAVLNVPGQFSRIDDAVDAASAGDTIVVAPGTYNRRVRVRRVDNLTIDGGGAAIMQVDSDDDAFRVRESDNVTINGFMINGGERGVRAKRSSGLTVTNNVMNNVEEGVRLRECTGANIMGNTVLGTSRGRGIRIDKSDDVTVDGNSVSGAAREGLRAKRANGLWILSGSFDGNRGGVRLTRVGAGTTGDSMVTGISANGNTRTGIRVRGGTGTSVSGNTANDNGRYGLRLEGSSFSLAAAQAGNFASGNCSGDFRVNNETVGGGCGDSTSTSSTSSTSIPGSSTTTIPGTSTTSIPGSSTTSIPGSSTTTIPGTSTTTIPGTSTTSIPGSSTTTIPGTSTTTVITPTTTVITPTTTTTLMPSM